MRLSTEQAALATIRAALDAGITTFDTAHAYANERLVAEALRAPHPDPLPAQRREGIRIVTKCGMRREGGAWIADGRAGRIAADAAASVEALGAAPDLLLLHAPDPAVAIATSARALAQARDRGLARAVGVSNVSR